MVSLVLVAGEARVLARRSPSAGDERPMRERSGTAIPARARATTARGPRSRGRGDRRAARRRRDSDRTARRPRRTTRRRRPARRTAVVALELAAVGTVPVGRQDRTGVVDHVDGLTADRDVVPRRRRRQLGRARRRRRRGARRCRRPARRGGSARTSARCRRAARGHGAPRCRWTTASRRPGVVSGSGPQKPAPPLHRVEHVAAGDRRRPSRAPRGRAGHRVLASRSTP